MIVKKYSDGTYNILYEPGDFVKIKEKSEYGDSDLPNADKWGEVVKVTGKPVTAKLTIDTEDGQVEQYVFNVIPVDNDGVELTEEQILSNSDISETNKITDYKNIIKFDDFE